MALTDILNAIGDAIREKTGTTELIPLVDMPSVILELSSGGGDYTEAYNLMSKQAPEENTENSVVNYLGLLAGVSE